MQAALRRVEGDRLHDSVDDAVARRGVHPGAVHGRHRRPAAARVRGHDRRRRFWSPGFVSISLTPMLCSRFLRPPHAQRHGWLYNAFERMFDAWLRALRLARCAAPALPRRDDGGVDRCCSAATVYLFTVVPKGFLPSEDQGRFKVNTEAAQGISFEDMVRHQTAGRRRSCRTTRTSQRHVDDRRRSATTAAAEQRPHLGRAEAARRADAVGRRGHRVAAARRWRRLPGIRAFMTNQPPINLGAGRAASARSYQFTLQDTDTAELYKWAPMLEEKIREHARPRGRQQRPAAEEPAGDRRHGPRQGVGARA